MRKFFCLAMLVLSLALAGCGNSSTPAASEPQKELHVAAAASLTDVMNELGAAYEKDHPDVKIVCNYGSSGALQQSIENGGGADLFFSAAQKQMDALDKAGLLADGTRKDLLKNEVVLIVPSKDGQALTSFQDLTDPSVKKVALGEPKGVPVGQYSEEILKKLNLFDAVKAKSVYGSDVRQVLTWVETGEADAGLVYATDAAATDGVKVVAKAPDGSHKPVIYPAAVLKDSKQLDLAKDFLAFVSSADNQQVFEKYGFEVIR